MNGQIDRTPVYPLTQCLYCVYYVHSLYKSQRCNEAGNKLQSTKIHTIHSNAMRWKYITTYLTLGSFLFII